MNLKNRLLELAIRFLQKLIPKHPHSERILVVSTTALGDTLWSTAAIENIRKSFPQCKLCVLTSPIGQQVLQHNPHIDEIFFFQEPLLPHFFALQKQLYRQKFDTVLLFHSSERLVLPLVSLIGASRIIGTFGLNKGLDSLLTEALPNHFQHEIVRRLEIAEKRGAKRKTEEISFYLKKEEQQIPTHSLGIRIALHPGSKDSFKRWPKEKFIELGRRLQKELACELLITGTPEELPLMEQIAQSIPGAVISNPRQTLRQFAAQLQQVDLLISNDTGPVHLAAALKRPLIAIYSATDPALCGPHHAKQAVAIFRRPSCQPCLKRKCRQPFCLLQIGVEEVFSAALNIFSLKHGLNTDLQSDDPLLFGRRQ